MSTLESFCAFVAFVVAVSVVVDVVVVVVKEEEDVLFGGIEVL